MDLGNDLQDDGSADAALRIFICHRDECFRLRKLRGTLDLGKPLDGLQKDQAVRKALEMFWSFVHDRRRLSEDAKKRNDN